MGVAYGMGSPPHTREEYDKVTQGWQQAGITPAYAGRIKLSGKEDFIRKDQVKCKTKLDFANLN